MIYFLGATHFGANQKDESGNLAMSALDFSPSLFQNWGVSFDYLNSEGHVHTAHAGRIRKHSECSVEVLDEHSPYSTYYSHIILSETIADNKTVQRGQLIGTIALYPDHANCNCDWANARYECSSGPHAHFELRKNDKPVSLDDRVISNYRIRAGKYPNDMFCSDPESCTGNDGSWCSTTFTDVNTKQVYCPTVKGQNLGKRNVVEA